MPAPPACTSTPPTNRRTAAAGLTTTAQRSVVRRSWWAVVARTSTWSAVALAAILAPDELSYRHLSLLTTATILAIVVYGLSILYGQAGLVSVGHAALIGVGAYEAAIFLREFDTTFWVVLPLAGVSGAVAAAVLGYPALRIHGVHYLIVTFAFGELFRIVVSNGGRRTGGAEGILIPARIQSLGPLTFTTSDAIFYLAAVGVACAAAVSYAIRRSWLGQAFTAIRENEILAESIGINLRRYKLAAFAISGAFAGVAGVLYAYHLRHIGPGLFDAVASLELILILLIGGANTIAGPLVGSVAIFFVPELIRIEPVEARIAYGIALIVVIVLFPQGLVAAARRIATNGRDLVARGVDRWPNRC